MSYYKNCNLLDLLNIEKIEEESLGFFYECLENEYGTIEFKNMMDNYNLPEYVMFNGKRVTENSLIPVCMSHDFYNKIEHMELLSDFFVEVGFASKNNYYSRFETSRNFMDSEEFPLLFEVSKRFGNLLLINDLTPRQKKELEAVKDLRYFENEEFIYIPDYGIFETMDVMGSLPNFVHKVSGYSIRFRKGVGRTAFVNQEIDTEEFEKILYCCKLSMID